MLASALVACASASEAGPHAPASAEPVLPAATAAGGQSSAAPPGPGTTEASPAQPSVQPTPAPAAGGEPPASSEAQCEAERARIDARLAEASRCGSDADCEVIMPGCPFGCFRAVHRATDSAAIEADIQAYGQSCAACVYRCRPLERPPACRAGRCSVE